MLKPKNLLLFLFFFTSYTFLFAADSLTITTYYPSPYGVYSRLKLSPHNDTDPTASCVNHAGEIYYDDSDNRLYVCNGTNWQSVGGGSGGWLLTGNADAGTYFIGTINNAAWIVKTANTERMRITANGKVGIGEISPNSKLEIKPPGSSEQAIESGGACLAGAAWPFTPCRGYALRGSVFGDGIATGIGVYGKGDYGVQGETLEGGVGVYGSGAIGVQGGQPGSLGVADFIAANSGYGDPSGYWPLFDPDSIPNSGDEYWTPSIPPPGGCSYGSASSIRWKKNIRPIDNALEKVLKLRGVYFDWDKEHGVKHDFGMVAEEVGELFPEAVVYETDSKYATGMDYSRLTAVLVEAVKDMQKEIDSLKSEISEIDALANPK